MDHLVLEQRIKYTLGKTERLKSRKAIDLLFKDGKSFSNFPFRVLWMFKPDAVHSLQAGFSVSAKYFRNATDRNRIKRLMRECYRLQKNDLQISLQASEKKMLVFFIYLGNELPQYQELYKRTTAVIKRLTKLNNENDPGNT